ncbi:MAG: disulfide bond formation protein DsbB [Gammaproteobacteria bacterium]|nr:disulfide bond formation protein DsbB [Gammaproteobacteria bacterium]
MSFDVDNRLPWLLVALSALALDGAALYFQYGLKLDPCVLCIYQRTAVGGIALGGLIGAVAPAFAWLRAVGYLGFGTAAIIGIDLALEHIAVQHGESMACDFFANFPSWAKLDEWFPAVFQPTGSCDEIKWSFLGHSMPEWMVVVFGAYLVALVFALWLEVRHFRARR